MSDAKPQQMPIFSKTYDLLVWLLQATRHFPKMHRHDFTKRLLDAAFDLRERLEEANYNQGREGRGRTGTGLELRMRLMQK